MPRVNIWIRVEDVDKWNAIKNRPEWLHEKLNEDVILLSNGNPEAYEPTGPLRGKGTSRTIYYHDIDRHMMEQMPKQKKNVL